MNGLDALEHRLLRSFVAVAEELHFGRAARRLSLSQPPLSLQIRRLEDRIGARLFDRDRRGVELTEAGRFLLDRARALLTDANLAFDETARIARGETGTLAIGYTPTATYEVLPALLRRFRKRHPGIRLQLTEMRSGLQAEALLRGRIEAGFACGPVASAGLVEHTLRRERFVAAVPAAHPLAKSRTIALKALARETFVSVRPDIEPAWANACAGALARSGIRLDVVQETDSKLALLGLVAAGMGVALVSESMKLIERTGVAYRDVGALKVRVPLVLLTTPSASARALALRREALLEAGSPSDVRKR
jgi:LysR family transcriptional regulator, benzoate and cis,cis-muconate-responsive activator of ben and cat genes